MEDAKTSTSPQLGVVSPLPTSPQPGILPVSSHHERLIHEVESSDGQLGAILRCVYSDSVGGEVYQILYCFK